MIAICALAPLGVLVLSQAGRLRYFFSNTGHVLENAYFVGGVSLAVVGLAALIATTSQLREASHTRYATVYLQITHEFLVSLSANRLAMVKLQRSLGVGGAVCPPETLDRKLQEMRASDVDSYFVHYALMSYMEHVGLLIRRRYVRDVDISLMIGAAYLQCYSAYSAHINGRKAENPFAFEHLSWCAARFQKLAAMRRQGHDLDTKLLP